jgi:glucose/arabinose dehydrogenase
VISPRNVCRTIPATVCAVALMVSMQSAGARPRDGSPPDPRRGEVFRRAASSQTPTLPAGFSDQAVITGLTFPTAVQFSSDGRVFVAQQSGVIDVFDGIDDPTPTVFADLSSEVYNYWDRGLLGLALSPAFPADPFVYVLYTLDAPIGGTPPVYNDQCTDPLGSGCVAGARLSRLMASGDHMSGPEQILLEGWCQQYPSHSIGTIGFGPDRALYVGGGEGASFTFADYGQGGSPKNPCGDPGGPNPAPPTAEGGALRSQDLRTSGDPTGFSGAILRVDPATGNALPDNPLFGGTVVDDDRIIAHGLRNPFRFAFRPGTSQVWVGDVGWNTFEEIDSMASPTDSVVENFGWPCYEGGPKQPDYDSLNLNVCETLYGQPGAVTPPFFTYSHSAPVVAGDGCPLNMGSVVSGMAFYRTGSYPTSLRGALFFADHARQCIWGIPRGPNGQLKANKRFLFVGGAGGPVDLKIGPAGDLFYVDYDDGEIHRIVHTS